MKKRSVFAARLAAVLAGFALTGLLAGCSARPFRYARPTIDTYSLDSDFINVEIVCPECEVELLPTKTSAGRNVTATVVARGNDETKHTVKVENGTLKIGHEEDSKLGIVLYRDKTQEIAVYLPEEEYQTISIQTKSGDIIVPDDFFFENASFQTVSGEIRSSAAIGRTLLAQSVSGHIRIEGTYPEYLEAYSASGNIEVLNTVGGSAWVESGSGNITLRQDVYEDELNIETTSGSVRFDESDARTINVKTTSGNVKGTLLSNKAYKVSTKSGSVKIPSMDDSSLTGTDGKDTYYGSCIINTGSGNIDMRAK